MAITPHAGDAGGVPHQGVRDGAWSGGLGARACAWGYASVHFGLLLACPEARAPVEPRCASCTAPASAGWARCVVPSFQVPLRLPFLHGMHCALTFLLKLAS